MSAVGKQWVEAGEADVRRRLASADGAWSLAEELPPVELLRAFDAAAKRLSLPSAAASLGLAADELDQQLTRLEAWLGCLLFERRRDALLLTADGASLWRSVAEAFSLLRRASARLRERAEASVIRISASPIYAELRLAPLVERLAVTFPNCRLEIVPTTRPVDPGADAIDFCVRCGEGDWIGDDGERLHPLWAIPVVGAGCPSPPPVRLDYPFRGSDMWRVWQLRGGHPGHGDIDIRRHAGADEALAACAAGQGVSLALLPVAQDWIAQGRLRPTGEGPALLVGWASLLGRPLAPTQRRLRAIRGWLQAMLGEH
jgi:DNA-binding transcriptional LysR family regulator